MSSAGNVLRAGAISCRDRDSTINQLIEMAVTSGPVIDNLHRLLGSVYLLGNGSGIYQVWNTET